MLNKARKTLPVAIAIVLVGGAGALAAGPLNGKTYVGPAPTRGTSSETKHPNSLHAGGNIMITVARNGRTATVRFTSPRPVLYCITGKTLHVQKTSPARISGGTFKATVTERFVAGPGAPGIVQVVTGRFSGKSVSGAIYTQAGECGGTSYYSATAH